MKNRWYIKGMMTEMTSVLIEKDVLRWKQRVMKSESVQLRLKPKLQYVFRLAGKHDVLLRKFQNLEEFLKEHFDNAIKHDTLLRKVLRMTQVEKNRKKLKFDLTMRKSVIY